MHRFKILLCRLLRQRNDFQRDLLVEHGGIGGIRAAERVRQLRLLTQKRVQLLPMRSCLAGGVARGNDLSAADALTFRLLADDDRHFAGQKLLGTHHKAGNGYPVADFAVDGRFQCVCAVAAHHQRAHNIGNQKHRHQYGCEF